VFNVDWCVFQLGELKAAEKLPALFGVVPPKNEAMLFNSTLAFSFFTSDDDSAVCELEDAFWVEVDVSFLSDDPQAAINRLESIKTDIFFIVI
jgi:hypothetical protein